VPAPAAVAELVGRFAAHREAYHSVDYNEAQLREEFLNPFFAALGWDVYNRKGYAGAYKEVIHEAALRIGGQTKAPDYAFRAGGTKASFFVEAKKPAVDIAEAQSPAYQLRRYAWSAKLPVSILTDFEELAVYDCRIRPVMTDKASTARVMFVTYTEYLDRWDELAGLFSPEAIRRGALERFVASKKVKKGTAEVDAAFLAEIETWRTELARNVALRNPALSPQDLNYAVQQTIDRIVFLRICEDRGIEPYGTLQALINGPSIYRRLAEVFERADQRYNSGLFHFSAEKDRPEPPDELTLGLTIDDRPLQEIVRNLYFPDSPYEFSVLPAEILGQVYEQFLGKVIRLTKGHQAKIEEKPEVRKAGGVYYTPAYIVDYIVRQTVGRLLNGGGRKAEGGGAKAEDRVAAGRAPPQVVPRGLTPKQAEKLRILDPACGSGSFLIGAYQYLLDWHRDWYVAHDPEKHARGRHPKLYRGPAGEWRLTSAERKRILLNNIYGVDIDPQAVEVTKLSLLLKVLEGESSESVNNQRRLFHERALPDLAGNIRCGNSLIGPDFYNGQQLSLLDDEERARINVFDWHDPHHGFGAIMSAGGFDAVIGNPPYVRMETFTKIKEYLRSRYAAHEERADLYVYFVEKAMRLLSDHGALGMIVSNKFIKAKYGTPLRRLLSNEAQIDTIADFAGARVFQGATVRTVVLIALSLGHEKEGEAHYVPVPDPDTIMALAAGELAVADHARKTEFAISARALTADSWQLGPKKNAAFLERLRKGRKTLSEWIHGRALFGLKTGLNSAFIIDEPTKKKLLRAGRRAANVLKPILFGRDVRRYHILDAKRFVIYCHPDRDIRRYPSVRRHLLEYRKALSKRATSQKWYELQQPAVGLLPRIERPKIVYPIIANECRFSLDRDGFFINDKLFLLPTDDIALLALLNSRLANFYFAAVCAALEGRGERYLEFRAQYVDPFPIPDHLRDQAAHARLFRLGEAMLGLNQRLTTARTAHEKTLLERQIAATDRQIDQLVYELYGLSEAEIALVEEATAVQRPAATSEQREEDP